MFCKGCNVPSDCVNNLDKSSTMRMEVIGETLLAYLANYLYVLCGVEDVDVGVLSETMIIALLQKKADGFYSNTRIQFVTDERQTIFRFKIFAKWLSTNPMAPDEKAKALEMFDFDHFTIKDLASTVRKSGLYSSDKIIERMKQLSDEIQRDLENKEEELEAVEEDLENTKEQLEELKQEKKEALSVKDQEINKLRKERKTLEEALNFIFYTHG